MQTFGFTCGYSAPVVLDQPFSASILNPTYPVVSTYIFLPSSGVEGGVVYKNTAGEVLWWPYISFGYNPIAATMILTSATVNGIPRTTAASPIMWAGRFHSMSKFHRLNFPLFSIIL